MPNTVDPERDPFIAAMRHFFKAQNKTQKWLASRLGLQEGTISAIMTGKTRQLKTMEKMSREFSHELDEAVQIGRNLLAGRSPEPSPALDLRGTEVAALERRFDGIEQRMSMMETVLRQIADMLLRDRPPQPEATTTRKTQAAR